MLLRLVLRRRHRVLRLLRCSIQRKRTPREFPRDSKRLIKEGIIIQPREYIILRLSIIPKQLRIELVPVLRRQPIQGIDIEGGV